MVAMSGAMHPNIVPNRGSRPCALLRQSFREGRKVRKRTLANLSAVPLEVIAGPRILEVIAGLRIVLEGGTAIDSLSEAFEKIGTTRTDTSPPCSAPCASCAWASPQRDRERDLVTAMILAPAQRFGPSSPLPDPAG